MASNVNKPTDLKKKDADINRKLQLYGIYRAFKAGKVPSVSRSHHKAQDSLFTRVCESTTH
jgi:hypothetical protein